MKRVCFRVLLMLTLTASIVGVDASRALAQSSTLGSESFQSLKSTWLQETQIQGRRAVAMAKGVAAEKLTWKPAPDNNAAANGELGDLFLRLAFSAWVRPTQFGAAPPTGFDVNVKQDDYAGSTRDKAKIADQMSQSFAYAEDVIRKLSESDLQKHVKLANGRDRTVMSLVADWVEYNSEHVGQLMIYSRVNGFTAPTPGQVATPGDGK